jgi:hypothetical protein
VVAPIEPWWCNERRHDDEADGAREGFETRCSAPMPAIFSALHWRKRDDENAGRTRAVAGLDEASGSGLKQASAREDSCTPCSWLC